MQRSPNILFISAFDAPFINEDYESLSAQFSLHRQTGSGIFALLKIIAALMQSDILFSWFASTYAAIGVIIAKQLGIKTVIVLGGVDVAADKEIGYGIWLNPWKAKLIKYALRNADKVLAVDASLKEEAKKRANYAGENIVCLPTGYDGLFWKPAGEKKNQVLTVASASDIPRFKVKGLDFLIETAQRLPAVDFLVIGVKPELAYRFRPPFNMKFLPQVSRNELLQYYQQSKIFCLPSRREGLSNALCEAMLTGCFPVATNVGGNATAMGTFGCLVEYGDVAGMANAIHKALGSTEDHSLGIRSRIISLFPKEKRRQELIKIIQGLAE